MLCRVELLKYAHFRCSHEDPRYRLVGTYLRISLCSINLEVVLGSGVARLVGLRVTPTDKLKFERVRS